MKKFLFAILVFLFLFAGYLSVLNLFVKADIYENGQTQQVEEFRYPSFYLKTFFTTNAEDLPTLASLKVNFKTELTLLGYDFLTFNEESLRIEEHSENEEVIEKDVPFFFEKGSNFSLENPSGTIYFLLNKQRAGERIFYIYFSNQKSESANRKESLFKLAQLAGKENLLEEELKKQAISVFAFYPEPEPAPKFEGLRGIYYIPTASDFVNDTYKSRLKTLKEWGINAIFLWVTSLDIVKSLDPQKYQDKESNFTASSLKNFILEAQNLGLNLYYWYSPHGYKNPKNQKAIELIEHPEWTWKDRKLNNFSTIGKFVEYGIDMAIPEAREYEAELIKNLLTKFPAKGIIIEEPYYYGDLSYSDAFRELVKKNFGFDPLDSSIDSKKQAEAMKATREFAMTEMMKKIRAVLTQNLPTAELLVNAPRQEYVPSGSGVNIAKWLEQGLFETYTPMIYDITFDGFLRDAEKNLQAFSEKTNLFPSVAFQWSGYTQEPPNPALLQELDYIEKSPFSGFILFANVHAFQNDNKKAQIEKIVTGIPKIKKTLNGRVVKGQIKDEKGKPIPNIILKIDSAKVLPDMEGRYVYYVLPGKHKLEVLSEGKTLFSEEKIINQRSQIDIQIDSSKLSLPKEVVVYDTSEGETASPPSPAPSPSPLPSLREPLPSPPTKAVPKENLYEQPQPTPSSTSLANASLELTSISERIINKLGYRRLNFFFEENKKLKKGDLIKLTLSNISNSRTSTRISLALYTKQKNGRYKLVRNINFKPVYFNKKETKIFSYKLPTTSNIYLLKITVRQSAKVKTQKVTLVYY